MVRLNDFQFNPGWLTLIFQKKHPGQTVGGLVIATRFIPKCNNEFLKGENSSNKPRAQLDMLWDCDVKTGLLHRQTTNV